MDNNDLTRFIVLLLVGKIEKFRDSHSLIKVLEWKFGVIGGLNTIKELINEKLINATLIGKIHHYEITENGDKLVKAKWNIGFDLLHKRYDMKEKEFIDVLQSN
jgi:hypothetical protein